MTTTDAARQIEAEDLARAKQMVQMILRDWDLMTWNELLADDVVLSIRMGALGAHRVGSFGAVGGNVKVAGREDAKRMLQSIYGDLRSGLSVTTEVVSGYDVALIGNLALRSTKENTQASSLPIVLYMAFDDEGKIDKMTIAAVDLRPLTDAIRTAVQGGAGRPS